MSGVDDRLLVLLKEQSARLDTRNGTHLARRGFWTQMEAMTSISSGRWRNFFAGQQNATTDMVEAAGRLHLQYAFWLTTGFVDPGAGHVAPEGVDAGDVAKRISMGVDLVRGKPSSSRRGDRSSELGGPQAHGD